MASKRFRKAVGIDPERVVSSALAAALGDTQPRGHKQHHPGRVLAAGAALAAAAAVGQKRMPRMAKVPLRMGLHKLGNRVDGVADALRDRVVGFEDEPVDDDYYDDEPEEFDDEPEDEDFDDEDEDLDDEPRAEDEDEDEDEDFDAEDDALADEDGDLDDEPRAEDDDLDDEDDDFDDENEEDEEDDDFDDEDDDPRAEDEPDDEDEGFDDEDDDGSDDEPEDDDGPRGDGEELDDEELDEVPEADLESEPDGEEVENAEPEVAEGDEDVEPGQDDQIAARSVDLGVPLEGGTRGRRDRAPDVFSALGTRRRRPPVMRRGSPRVDPAARPPEPDASRSRDQRRANPKSKAARA